MSAISIKTFPLPRVSGSVIIQLKSIIGGMHDFDLAMGSQSLRVGLRRILAGMVVVAVSKATRDFLVGLNGDIHRGRKFSIDASDGGIVFH